MKKILEVVKQMLHKRHAETRRIIKGHEANPRVPAR